MFRAFTCSKVTLQDEFAENFIYLFSAFYLFTLVLVNGSLRFHINKKRQALHRQMFSSVDRICALLHSGLSGSADFIPYQILQFQVWPLQFLWTRASITLANAFTHWLVLLLQSFIPRPALPTCIVPGWQYPCNSSVSTRANRGWKIKSACPKHFLAESCVFFFFQRSCRNGSLHIRKPHETFISAAHRNALGFWGSCKIDWAKQGDYYDRFICWHLFVFMLVLVLLCHVSKP